MFFAVPATARPALTSSGRLIYLVKIHFPQLFLNRRHAASTNNTITIGKIMVLNIFKL